MIPRPYRWNTPEKFMSKVSQSDGCWLWTGLLTVHGYGQIDYQGKRRSVHRLAYELFVGPIPTGLQLDHKCHVRNCVRPDHLEPVTNRENSLRGRNPTVLSHWSRVCERGHQMTERTKTGWGCKVCRYWAQRANRWSEAT